MAFRSFDWDTKLSFRKIETFIIIMYNHKMNSSTLEVKIITINSSRSIVNNEFSFRQRSIISKSYPLIHLDTGVIVISLILFDLYSASVDSRILHLHNQAFKKLSSSLSFPQTQTHTHVCTHSPVRSLQVK